MTAYVKHLIWLNEPVDPKAKKPITRRDNMLQLQKSGIPQPDLELPPFPDELGYVFKWFCDLRQHGFDPMQMQAYFALRKITPTRREIDMLTALSKL